MYNFRTDLAVERRDVFKKANKIENDIDGVETEEYEEGDKIKIAKVKIVNEKGQEALGKPIGNYITIDIKKLKIATEEDIENSAVTLSKQLKELLDINIEKRDEILVVGLGNQYVTPDSLGPKVVADIDITRHILNYMPQYLEPDTRPVSAISPGVLRYYWNRNTRNIKRNCR